MSQHRFFLLDAMALIYRAYYSMIKSPRITSYGKNTNASLGFTNTLVDILTNENPSHIAVAFDSYEPTERHEQFASYKANREPAPEEIINSLEDIKHIISGFNIPMYEVAGYEADDIIGTIATQFYDKKDYEIYMVTPDKDYGQLVRENVFIYKPPYMGKGFEKIDEKAICAKWNIESVQQVIDMLALMGDASDNIPGIPGIGEKTAAKLLKQYQTVENILQHSEEIEGSIGKKVKSGIKSAQMSYALASIIIDVPVKWNIAECERQSWNENKLQDIFNQLEFRTLARRVLGSHSQAAQGTKKQPTLFQEEDSKESKTLMTIESNTHQYRVIEHIADIEILFKNIQSIHHICIDTETTGLDIEECDLIGISLSIVEKEAYYIPCLNKEIRETILSCLQELNAQQPKCWIGHNIKFDLMVLDKYNISLQGSFFDTMLAQYVLNPESKKSMDTMSVQYLNYQPIAITELISNDKKKQKTLAEVDLQQVGEYACEDADITLQLYHHLLPRITEKSLETVLHKVENPLVPVLARMEANGVRIDANFLSAHSSDLQKEIVVCEEKIYELAGEEFNIASPKQLGDILFDKIKISEKALKTKTKQYATGEEVLVKLLDKHPIIAYILNYRELQKLKSTYVDALPKLIRKSTGKIHTSYKQAVAVTGRLSSQHPNLQNIPIRTERGREIRKAFIPTSKNHYILSADYSQIELRIIASMSKDPALCTAFRSEQDIHTATASSVYNVELQDVTPEMRYRAKSVNFGIIYGQGAWGLSENLKIPLKESKELIHQYFTEYPGVKKYMEQQIAQAKEMGYVETLVGRKRYLPTIHSNNATVRGFAERNAINSPIQGTAADMIKLAMIKIDKELYKQQLKSKMTLQVHDELVFDVPQDETNIIKQLVRKHMIEALPLSVPIEVSIGVGSNWLEAH